MRPIKSGAEPESPSDTSNPYPIRISGKGHSFTPACLTEDQAYLQSQLITCIGNKRALIPWIDQAVQHVRRRLGFRKLVCADLFSGSGVVARYFKQFCDYLLVNDLESYSRVINECYLSNMSQLDIPLLREIYEDLLRRIEQSPRPGFITELYSPADQDKITSSDRVFYTRDNAVYLDTARYWIGELEDRLGRLFLGPLLSRASVHANTAGVFKGFYKNKDGVGQFGGNGRDAISRICAPIRLDFPVFSRFECDYRVYQQDANDLVLRMKEVDLAYIDPPYNQHPYGSNYFMLNLLVDYRRPRRISRVSGIPIDWRRSSYNKRRESEKALFDLLQACPAKFLLVSYNSEGFIDSDRMTQFLKSLGPCSTFQTSYTTFRGSRNLRSRSPKVTEYLFLVEKK
jgi:adenine-specific DNA-methyltransferase